jgi:hypothetical protein
MLHGKRVRLHDHSGSRFAVVADCCHRYYVTSPHRPSNSETDSIQPIATNSRVRSRRATSFAIRRRTAFERASGTIKRNSRRPRALRRSRIAFIRSEGSAIGSLQCNA